MDSKHDISTQTELFDDTELVLSQPDADILYTYFQQALNPEFHHINLFNQTLDVFNRIKHDPHNIVELRLCVKIGLIFIDAFEHKPGYSKILKETYAMIGMLLPQLSATHDASERMVLEQYIRVHDLALSLKKNAEHIEPLAHIIGVRPDAELPISEDKSTQTLTTYASITPEKPTHVMPRFAQSYPATASLKHDPVETLHQDLAFRFKNLQDMIAEAKHRKPEEKRKLNRPFSNLQNDIWSFLKQITRENAPSEHHVLGGPLLEALFLVLNIQLAHITFLDDCNHTGPNPTYNLQKISSAMQLMAQLLRVFNTYYQLSDAEPCQKQEMQRYYDYIQGKSLDAKELSTYKKILTCTCLTKDEKGQVSEKFQFLHKLQVKHVGELFQSFYHIQNESQPVITEDTTVPALRDACTRALKNKLNPHALREILRCATHRLNLEFNEVMSLTPDQHVAVPYIDGDILRQDMTYMPYENILAFYDGAGVDKLRLLIILDVYYKIKIAYLEAYIPTITSNENGYLEYENHQLFSSHFRRDALKFLLLDDSKYTAEAVLKNTTDLAYNIELSTPFIRDLAHYKLEKLACLKKVVEAKEMPELDPISAEINTAPASQQHPSKPKAQTKRGQSKSKSKSKGPAKKPASSSTALTQSGFDQQEDLSHVFEKFIKQFGSIYLLQLAPGWSDCRAEVKSLLHVNNLDLAEQLIEDWMHDALLDENAESTPFKISIFEAIFYKALIEKSRQNYDSALAMLNILKNYRVSQSYQAVYAEQTQQILCEEALIYELKNQPENAERCFAEAASRAEERGMVCFPSVYYWAKQSPSNHHLASYERYTTYLEQLAPIAIDDYSLPYVHKFYYILLQHHVLSGISGTFQRIAGHALATKSSLNPNAEAVHVINLLLNTRFDERSFDTKLELLLLHAKTKATLHFDSYTKQSRDDVLESIRALKKYELTDDMQAEIHQLQTMMDLTGSSTQRLKMKAGRGKGIQKLAGGSHQEEFSNTLFQTMQRFSAGPGNSEEQKMLSAFAQFIQQKMEEAPPEAAHRPLGR